VAAADFERPRKGGGSFFSGHDEICRAIALLEIEHEKSFSEKFSNSAQWGTNTMPRIKSLLFLLALAAQVPLASATVTYAVGSCKPSLRSFGTIMDALGATPAPNVVEVCPGTYPEQVVITFPATLEGISAGNLTRAVITVPPGGLLANATSVNGDTLAVQVLVENAAAGVNLTNLTVDGSGNNVSTAFSPPWIVGVFYQNSAGTMNHLTFRNQNGNGLGIGVWLEGGSANPSVTLEDSNIHGFDNTGIFTETNSNPGDPKLTATVKGNYVSPGPPLCATAGCSIPGGISFETGATASAGSNLITGGAFAWGMAISNDGGSVSKNTVIGTALGIYMSGDASVTSNTIYNSYVGMEGFLGSAQVTGNAIIQSNYAIDFACNTATNTHSNTILGAAQALAGVPTGLASSNAYYNVGTIRAGDGC
jgi:hypothetical protein